VLQAENQKQIDAINARIKAEEDAQKAGIANNLKAEKEKLAMLNFEKSKYIAEQNRLAKQERAIAQIESTASLISGVSAAIGSSGGNPIIAAIQIAGLLAVFAASMAKAKAAAKSFGKGGILSGKSHDQGGIYIPELNSEVEGGEYVINKRSTRKHKLFLDAINKDAKWLANINLNGQRDVSVSVNFEDSKNLAETNTILRRNGQKASWVDGQYYCKKDGIVITRVKR
jgi:hypothetical protein